MSTHVLDASGSRPLTTTINSPARTAATVQAKPGDDVTISLGNFDYVEIPIPTTPGVCEIVVRRKTEKKPKLDERGEYVRDEERKIIYEEVETESRTLRLRAFAYVSAHTKPEESSTPHTTMSVRNLAKAEHLPVWLSGVVVSEEKVDLGYGVER